MDRIELPPENGANGEPDGERKPVRITGSWAVDITIVTAGLLLAVGYTWTQAMPPSPSWAAPNSEWQAWLSTGSTPHLWGVAMTVAPFALGIVNYGIREALSLILRGPARTAAAATTGVMGCASVLAFFLLWLPYCWPNTGLSGFWTAVWRIIVWTISFSCVTYALSARQERHVWPRGALVTAVLANLICVTMPTLSLGLSALSASTTLVQRQAAKYAGG